jgi:hypothetical protein
VDGISEKDPEPLGDDGLHGREDGPPNPGTLPWSISRKFPRVRSSEAVRNDGWAAEIPATPGSNGDSIARLVDPGMMINSVASAAIASSTTSGSPGGSAPGASASAPPYSPKGIASRDPPPGSRASSTGARGARQKECALRTFSSRTQPDPGQRWTGGGPRLGACAVMGRARHGARRFHSLRTVYGALTVVRLPVRSGT